MKPALRATLLLTFALGAIVGMAEGLVIMLGYGLGFVWPSIELVTIALRYGVLAILLLPVGVFFARLLRLPHSTPVDRAGWAALGLGWIILNWWLHDEIFRHTPIYAPIPLASTVGSGVAVFVLHAVIRALQGPRARLGMRALTFLLIGIPVYAQLALQETAQLPEAGTANAGSPDITVVVIDTLRADHLGTYGYEREDGQITSPVIDAFAETGVVFETTWSQAPWTRPSMAALHSGLFCTAHTVNQIYDRLPDGATTLAEMAYAQGYRTGGFSANANVGVTYGFGQGFETLWTVGKATSLLHMTRWGEFERLFFNIMMGKFIYDGADHAALVNEQTFAWLDEVTEDARPKFTYVHYIDPHTPYMPPEDGWLFEGEPVDVMAAFDQEELRRGGQVHEFPFDSLRLSEEAVQEAIRMYDAEIRYVDQQFGLLLDGLRERGLLDEGDWLILTSDHGEEFMEHGRLGHGQSLFEEQVHVPLIVVGPEARPGARQAEGVNLLDVHQTVADLVGFEWPANEEGERLPMTPSLSLLPLLDGEPAEKSRLLYAERLQDHLELRAVRRDFRKVIEMPDYEYTTDADPQIVQFWFDLENNPEEITGIDLRMLAETKSPPRDHEMFDVPSDLSELLETGRSASKLGALKGMAADMSKAERQKLIDLGYMDADGNVTHGAVGGN